MKLENMKQSELTEQIKLFEWARQNERFIPELRMLHHIPNEGKRTNGAVLKAAGVRRGMPDVVLPVGRKGYSALYIELKFGDNRPTKEQREIMAALRRLGNKAEICRSAEEAREIIRHYLAKADNFDLVNCEDAEKVFDKCRGYNLDWTPCPDCEFYEKQEGE